jgi:hypothetical protein
MQFSDPGKSWSRPSRLSFAECGVLEYLKHRCSPLPHPSPVAATDKGRHEANVRLLNT